MAQKLHRGRKKVFHKRRKTPLKAVGWLLAAAVLITGGYFGAKFLMEERPPAAPSSSGAPSVPVSDPVPPPASSSPVSDAPVPDKTPVLGEATRAVYLPLSSLKDEAALDGTLEAAAGAGFNAILFDVKDIEGRVLFASATQAAATAQSVAADAVPLETLKALFQTLEDKGFIAIPRLYAFRDPLAPRRLPAAKIGLEGNPGWTWYDGNPKSGGRPWLNPYADAAHTYLIDLLMELKEAGAPAVMLDGVEFPRYLGEANYTAAQLTASSKAAALTAFVGKAREALGETKVLLASSGLAALGTDTALYGGNPVTFGAAGAAPVLSPSTLGKSLSFGEVKVDNPAGHPYEAVKAALSQIQVRLQVIDSEDRPFLLPWLQGDTYSAEEMKAQMRAVIETAGETASYILYNPDGAYDFSALK